eukprot:6949593-Pyramimonas_sp.AAC.3
MDGAAYGATHGWRNSLLGGTLSAQTMANIMCKLVLGACRAGVAGAVRLGPLGSRKRQAGDTSRAPHTARGPWRTGGRVGQEWQVPSRLQLVRSHCFSCLSFERLLEAV